MFEVVAESPAATAASVRLPPARAAKSNRIRTGATMFATHGNAAFSKGVPDSLTRLATTKACVGNQGLAVPRTRCFSASKGKRSKLAN